MPTLHRRISQVIIVLVALCIGTLAHGQAIPDLRVLDDILQQAVAPTPHQPAQIASTAPQVSIPGAVLEVGHNGQVIYRKAFGWRSLEPARELMTADTIFDVASLTKCLVTATAATQLLEEGRLRLNDPVAKYVPEFASNGKQDITIRQLLTHFSGLREDLTTGGWSGKQAAYDLANREIPVSPPGASFRYSDINFIVLGEIVERLSGLPLEQYATERIFAPLGMTHTRYLPPSSWVASIAPTQYEDGYMLRGIVHDPTARQMGGVAGHAGVFSTADDLARFSQAILDGKFVLSEAGLQKMTTPQQPPTATVLRGLGWDIDSPFSSNRGELLPVGGFGHTGFTGTSLWIDPTTNTYIILLTNAVHPHPRPGSPAVALRARVADAVAAALKLNPDEQQKTRMSAITGYNESLTGARRLQSRNGQVKTGLDVIIERGNLFTPAAATVSENPRPATCAARPCRIGLITNQTGLDVQGRRNVDLISRMAGVKLKAIFSPEHGITGALDTTAIANSRDQATGVPIYSVYGATDTDRRPSLNVLRDLDAVVFDIQDAGARWYTYETTLGYFLEACAATKVPLIVLDRPNPITGSFVQGPVSDPGQQRFVNYYTIPIRHGMTTGELARLFNAERHIGANLHVVRMQGWQRGDWFDATGLAWTNPSPNLRSLEAAVLYPGIALIEGTNVSVGRGTDTPFQLLGAPWIDARQLAAYLNQRQLGGVRFIPVSFTPTESNYANQLCHGVHIVLTARNQLDSPELGFELASALLKLYSLQFKPDRIPELLAQQQSFQSLLRGDDPRRIAGDWHAQLQAFSKIRQKYLLY